MAKETNRIDIYQAVTDDILAMLEAGTKPWVKPWSGGPTIPLRHNGVAYRGINVLSLWASAMRQGFASPYWLTFKQALELGGNVRKGSKGTTIVYANKLVVKDSETDNERAIPFLKRYTVFNADQVEGLDGKYPAPAPIITNPETRDVELEVIFSRIDATVRIGGSQAYYHPRADSIQMPAFEAFHSAYDSYAPLAHEPVHPAWPERHLHRHTPTSTNPTHPPRAVELEVMFCRIDATVRIVGSQAYYHTRDDYSQMPAFEAFHSADDYYATLAHEAVHHAGHESRLNRKTLISTSRADYARDELVAELGASFIGAIVGFKVEEREDHAAYIEHWLTALRNDKRAIFEAAREAQNAADYLLAMMTDQAD